MLSESILEYEYILEFSVFMSSTSGILPFIENKPFIIYTVIMLKTLLCLVLFLSFVLQIKSYSLTKNRDEQAKEEAIEFDQKLDKLKETQFYSLGDESAENTEDKDVYLLQNRQREGGKPQEAKGGKDGSGKVQYSIGSGNSSGKNGGRCDLSARRNCLPTQDCNELLKSVRCCNREAYTCGSERDWKMLLHYQTHLNKAYNDFCQYTYKAINCFQHIEWGNQTINMFCNNAAITRHLEFTRSFCEHKHQVCKKLPKTEECIKSWSDLMCCKAVSNRLSGVVYTWDDKCPEERQGPPDLNPAGAPGSQFRLGGGEVENKNNKKSEKEEEEMMGTFVIEVETPPEHRINHRIEKADFDL